MKLISFNIWGGKEYQELKRFIALHAVSTDIFCFQEVFASSRADIEQSGATRIHLLNELKSLLPEFSDFYFPTQAHFTNAGRVDFDIRMGQATFVRKKLEVASSGGVFTYGSQDSAVKDNFEDTPSAFSYVRVPYRGATLTLMNFHGVAFPWDKLDTPTRLEQSRRIREFARQEKGEVIVCGDFNLMPETESIALLEEDMLNLIKTYGISTTRSTITPYYGTPEQQNFADYTFVSKGIHVTNFRVPADCVASDHLPMILEFD